MARRGAERTSKVRGQRWQILTGTVAIGALSLATAGCGFPSAGARSAGDTTGDTAIVECRSGIVTDGDVQTSSLSVTKVPAAHIPDLPGGCSVTP
jgi:hypothetical protein